MKTQPTDQSVRDFLEAVEDEKKRADAHTICELMQEVTGEEPRMWGPSIVGFGSYHYVYASGREGDWMEVGFSPRKKNFSLYIMSGFDGNEDLMAQLGKHKTGKSCLYVNKLADLDLDVLRTLITRSVEHIRETYPTAS